MNNGIYTAVPTGMAAFVIVTFVDNPSDDRTPATAKRYPHENQLTKNKRRRKERRKPTIFLLSSSI